MSKIFFGIGVVVVLAGVMAGLWHLGWLGGERALWRQIKDKPALAELYQKARIKEREIAKELEKAEKYFTLGLLWKSIAEQGGPAEFFKKSLAIYEDGIARFGTKNILFYLNGGSVAEQMGDYVKAEIYFKKAIEISPADESGYLDLAELYEYKLKKTKSEILTVFKSGEGKMISALPLISARATYLRRAGDKAAALKDYEILSQSFPNNQGYKDIIAELKSDL